MRLRPLRYEPRRTDITTATEKPPNVILYYIGRPYRRDRGGGLRVTLRVYGMFETFEFSPPPRGNNIVLYNIGTERVSSLYLRDLSGVRVDVAGRVGVLQEVAWTSMVKC